MTPSRIWLADHLLRDGIGHHLGYNLAIARAASEFGYIPVILGHRRLNSDLFGSVAVKNIFRTDYRASPPSWIARNYYFLRVLERYCATRYRKDLNCFSAPVGSDDLVFAQMIAPRHFTEWMSWMREQSIPPHLILHLGYQPQRFSAASVRNAWQCLGESKKRRVTFVTDSEKLVGQFEQALRLDKRVIHLPHVVERQFPRVTAVRKKSPVVFFAPGNPRREKGFGDLLPALGRVRDLLEDGKIALRIQCHCPDSYASALLAKRPVLPGVVWFDRPLTDEEYAREFDRADVLLVPYHLEHYEARSSGVFCEARVAGRPIVASRGSWAGDRVQRQGGGWLCEERSPESLAEAIREAFDSWETAATRAAELQDSSRNEFSARHFVEKLAELSSNDDG